jgi:hypothetical protein
LCGRATGTNATEFEKKIQAHDGPLQKAKG